MSYFLRGLGAIAACVLILSHTSLASDLPKLSFNELTDNSELIVSGNVTRTWADWDPDHKYIWTHYELTVAAAHKGAAARTVDIAEPGGQIDGVVMSISGAAGYKVGDNVMVFLSRMPNGYLRTAGFGQGKFVIDPAGRLHGAISLRTDSNAPQSSVRSLENMTVSEAGRLVATRARGGNAQ